MDIKVLEDFLTVAREKNITKAANILNMTQPVLSRRLMGLEEELGIKLFERKGRGIVLTEDGQELKERAQKMVVLYKDMRETFDKKEMISGEIGIGCAETKSMSFMTRQMAMFRKQYPNVRFNLYTATADVVKDKMENGVLNLGLLKEPVDIDKYEYMRVPERDRWGILTRKDSPLAEKETICPEDLLDEPLILPVRPGMKGEVKSWFGKYSDRLNLAATGTTILNCVPMVREGVGTAIWLDLNISDEKLCFIPLSPALTNGSVLVWKEEQNHSKLIASFIRQCRGEKEM